jgi:hypothetical protein
VNGAGSTTARVASTNAFARNDAQRGLVTNWLTRALTVGTSLSTETDWSDDDLE